MTSIYDQRYVRLVEHLATLRKEARITQEQLAIQLRTDQSTISKIESVERRLDLVELHDWLSALGADHEQFLRDVGWLNERIDANLPALPMPGRATEGVENGIRGVVIEMAWQGQRKEVFIANLSPESYLKLEGAITELYQRLNTGNGGKNREAISNALGMAIHSFPDVNPSDLYHHVVYRLYLREYTKTQADRSWVRAGGEALELFLERHYNAILRNAGVELRWLYNDNLKQAALSEMGIHTEVGGSKLDIALYGKQGGISRIFGGIHVKASLAERVSDDVPCSIVMMRNGMVSYLLTLDAKSYPPPTGDLVNKGELGSPMAPSDKRAYIESHGSFDACFSYNLRTVPSAPITPSGKRIYTSTFNPRIDPLPQVVLAAWNSFQNRQRKF